MIEMDEELRRKKYRLVNRLIREGYLRSSRCVKAFLKVPRERFIWPGYESMAYHDSPLPLGDTGQTISAPHMCAYLIECLNLVEGLKVLEIGTGSGYQAALLAECVAPSDRDPDKWGHVYTIEINEELVEFAKRNLERCGYSNRVTVIRGDGSLGWPPQSDEEIYDRILLTAAAPTIPKPLIKQLKKGGYLVGPLGKGYLQDLVRVNKDLDGVVREENLLKVAFVPLRGRWGWIK